MHYDELSTTMDHLLQDGKGILAADESNGTIGKRFATINVENNENNRRDYRLLLATTPDLSQYINGVILFEETFENKDEHGTPIAELFSANGIIPGIKVDKGLVHLANTDDEKILAKLSHTINGVLKGYILIAFIQGILMGIGLAIFHVPNPAIWAVIAGIAAIIPPLGTAVVSVPTVLFLFFTGHTGLSIGFLIWAILIVGTGDNLLNPYIVGHRIDVPPFLILFSVLGGIALLGPVGILIGPLTVSLLYSLTEIYQSEFK